RYVERVKSVLDYAKEENHCRSKVLLGYFGETGAGACGKCDICLKNSENLLTDEEFAQIKSAILQVLQEKELTIGNLAKKLSYKEIKVMQVIRLLLDQQQIIQNEQMKLQLPL
ncbi:MAG TPA: RecQ family zinc-binding domain-containing protein, partial [Paludibacteraceae bacterium]|nr:RecQ family zinc-binding domain-containing protein [Paludibacteraceae bacterium]